MAKRATSKAAARAPLKDRARAGLGAVLRRGVRVLVWAVALLGLWVLAYRWIDPPTTPYVTAERMRHGTVARDWVDLDDMAPVLARSAVAAEDANFCRHWGFDLDAIRDALADGAGRGASTISQQTVKNAFLWQGRSWPRKALEALLTPVAETLWPKRRMLEIYLNVAEFDRGVFGVEAAARRYFGVGASEVSARQAALLMAVLPDPKDRDAARPTAFLDRRARSIADGAATIRADGRAACFED